MSKFDPETTDMLLMMLFIIVVIGFTCSYLTPIEIHNPCTCEVSK